MYSMIKCHKMMKEFLGEDRLALDTEDHSALDTDHLDSADRSSVRMAMDSAGHSIVRMATAMDLGDRSLAEYLADCWEVH